MLMRQGDGQELIGEAGRMQCPECGENSSATAFVYYNYVQFFFLFSFVTTREYLLRCGACGASYHTNKSEIAGIMPEKDPIPFLHRKGWLVCLIAVLCYAVYSYAREWLF